MIGTIKMVNRVPATIVKLFEKVNFGKVKIKIIFWNFII